MLNNISFFPALAKFKLADNTKINRSHILVYGAILAHSFGQRGCIASNETIAKETMLQKATVANYISLLNKSGWIRVEIDENNHRICIVPLLEISLPIHRGVNTLSPISEYPLHTTVNIEYSKENTVRETSTNVEGLTSYGKAEINELFDAWEEIVGYKIQSNIKQNRKAASNLLRKYDKKDVVQLIYGVHKAQQERYAPQISDFVDLQLKLNKLIAWGQKVRNEQLPSF